MGDGAASAQDLGAAVAGAKLGGRTDSTLRETRSKCQSRLLPASHGCRDQVSSLEGNDDDPSIMPIQQKTAVSRERGPCHWTEHLRVVMAVLAVPVVVSIRRKIFDRRRGCGRRNGGRWE